MKAKAYSLSDPGGQGLDIVLLVCINTKIIRYEADILISTLLFRLNSNEFGTICHSRNLLYVNINHLFITTVTTLTTSHYEAYIECSNTIV